MQKKEKHSFLRIIPLGGCEEVGRNMTVFEYENDIIILDMGIQFPEEDMPGIDFVIPNIKYLQGKEKNIKAVILSHGHLDHIGAAPILLEKLNNPPVIGRDLTVALLKGRQEDYKKGTSGNLNAIIVKDMDKVHTFGSFKIKFFAIEHSIMDAMGVIIESPAATVIHPGDWTMERNEQGISTIDYSQLSELARPTVLMLESLGATRSEKTPNSKQVYENLFNIISEAEGRVIIGTFASQIKRIEWLMEASKKFGRKVALDGYSMKKNIAIAKELGYIKIQEKNLIDVKDIDDYEDKNLIILCTGAQGEETAVLPRIVDNKHPYVQLKKTDTVIFSSSVIPGNERAIQKLKDNIYRQSDHVIHSEIMDVHWSGHADKEDVREIIKMIKPDYLIPVYANHYLLKEAAMLAIKDGFPKDKVFVPDNGSIISVDKKSAKLLREKAPSDYVFVDGLGITDTQNIVLRDRHILAEDGMVVVIVTVDTKTGNLVQNPDIISRGFVFLKENKALIEELRSKVKKMVVKSSPKTWADSNMIKNTIREKVGQFLFLKTQKRPMVLPVVIEV